MRPLMTSAFAVTLFLLASAAPAVAQRRELAVLGGGNYTTATGGNLAHTEGRSGFLGGLSLRVPRGAHVSLQAELLINRRRLYGERAASDLNPLLLGPKQESTGLLYVQLPLMLRIQRGYSTLHPVRPYLSLGAYAAVLIRCHRETVEADDTPWSGDCSATPTGAGGGTSPFVPAVYQDVDGGVVGALGVEIRRFAVSLRGERSIRNLVDPGALVSSPFERARLWSAAVTLEYLLRVL